MVGEVRGIRMSRTHFLVWLLLCGAMAVACSGPAVRSSGPAGLVGADSVWLPDMKSLRNAMAEHCLESAPEGAYKCFLEVMDMLGAGQAAVRFSASLGTAAYLYAFQPAGPVDLGWVHYPFRANENHGCIILNGTPGQVDVDGPAFMPLKALDRHGQYQALKKAFPNVSIWPGDRTGSGRVVVQDLAGGGRRFVIGYELRNGCHACELLGYVDFSFDFDEEGTFIKSSPLAVAEVIHTVAGKNVSLTLEIGPEGSGGWRMIRLPPPEFLGLEKKAAGPRSKSMEMETWTFAAGNPGRILVHFRRMDAGAEEVFPIARASYLVVIHKDEGDMDSALEKEFSPIITRRLAEMGSPRAGKVALRIKGVNRDLARVDISPEDPLGDEWAIIYLRRQEEDWVILGIGRSFPASFYDSNFVPMELQGPVDEDASYGPPPLESCKHLLAAISSALGLKGGLVEGAPFFDYSGLSHGEGCRITMTGTGDMAAGPREVIAGIRSVLEDRGYTEDQSYAADGPLGTTRAFYKKKSLVLASVVAEPAEEAGLLSIRPVCISELLPEEIRYTIIIMAAEQQ